MAFSIYYLALLGLGVVFAVLIRPFLEQRHQKRKDEPPTLDKARDAEPVTTSKVQPLSSFNWEKTRPVQFRPFKPIYHITMALQSTSPEDLIVMDCDYKDKIETRRGVIASNPGTVMGVTSSSDAAAQEPSAKAIVDEVYTYLMSSYLPARYPTIFTKESTPASKTAVLHNHVTGSTFPCTPPLDPLEAFRILGETVEDDIFLLREEDVASTPSSQDGPAYPPTSHRLVAFLCCFPAGFDPSSKLGLLLKDIHKPVPSYDKIGPSMERFFARLEVGKSAKRLNWSVQTHTDLFAPSGNHVHEGDEVENDAAVDIDMARLRVECQTLTRLPQTRAILFSFKTYLFPIKDIKAEGLGPDLADAIEGLKEGNAPGMWTYKGGVRWGKNVCEHLRA